jgi:hypothetical protein
MSARDIYKLIHQGVFGPGHLIASVEQARRALKDEVRSQKLEGRRQNGRPEQLIEEIEPGGKLVRVNLRRLAGDEDATWLADGLVESAGRVRGDPRLMKRRLAAAVRWCRENLPGEAAALERLSARAERAGFPAFHHSRTYARAYRPAYRVILSGCWKRRAAGRAG